jgi:hypothetical protein
MPDSQAPPEVSLFETEICPHLGIEEDIRTCLAYPSHWNICHHSKPASTVRLEHQRTMCLSPAHTGCPIFQSEQVAPLPVELRGRKSLGAPRRDSHLHGS